MFGLHKENTERLLTQQRHHFCDARNPPGALCHRRQIIDLLGEQSTGNELLQFTDEITKLRRLQTVQSTRTGYRSLSSKAN